MSFPLIYSWYHLFDFGPVLQVLNSLENDHFKCEELYMCDTSVVHLSSVVVVYTETCMQMRGSIKES